jgi:hypothetical protein
MTTRPFQKIQAQQLSPGMELGKGKHTNKLKHTAGNTEFSQLLAAIEGPPTKGEQSLEEFLIPQEENEVLPEGGNKKLFFPGTKKASFNETLLEEGTKLQGKRSAFFPASKENLEKLQSSSRDMAVSDLSQAGQSEDPSDISFGQQNASFRSAHLPAARTGVPPVKLQAAQMNDQTLQELAEQRASDLPQVNGYQGMQKYAQSREILDDKIIKMSDFHSRPWQGAENASAPEASENNKMTIVDLLARGAHSSGKNEGNDSLTLINNKTATLDLSALSAQRPQELINQIVDYLQQNNIQNQNQIEVFVRHQDLGQFSIQVIKDQGPDQVKMEIKTANDVGQQFFQNQEQNLRLALQDAGVKLTDMRITMSGPLIRANDSSGQMFSSNDQGQSYDPQQRRQQEQHQQNPQHDSRRRQELWDILRERRGA